MNEPENFEKDFSINSQEFAIVDASVLQGLDHPLVKKAVIVPVKYADVIFRISAQYDDTILRKLTITPSPDESDPKAIKRRSETPSPKEVGKGLNPGERDTDNTHLVGEEFKSQKHGGHGASTAHDKLRRKLGTPNDKDKPRSLRPVGNDNPNGIGRHAPKSPTPRRRSNMRRLAASQSARPTTVENRKNEVVNFVVSNMGKSIAADQLRAFEHKEMLSESLNMLMAMAMGGWEHKDGFITNGKYLLNENDWDLDGGFLTNAEELAFDFDWIYDTKRSIDRLIQEDINTNANILVESLSGRR